MLSLATVLFALAASAFPLASTSNFTSSGNQSLASVDSRSSCTEGQLVCRGQTQWGLCNHGAVIFQAVAAGTICVNGQIQHAGGQNGPRPASPPPHRPTHAPAPPAHRPTSHPSAPRPAPHPAPRPAPHPAPHPPHPAPPIAPGGYVMHTGNGAISAGWPAATKFPAFETLWAANVPVMQKSCTQFRQPNNSPQEIADIKTAVQSVAQSTGVDARFVLAIMMQESKGCVRVWSTSLSVGNPGLMQSHSGSGSCNTGTSTVAGTVQNPCPASQITQMVQDGVAGTSSGPGLKQAIAQSGATDATKYYKAARIYNSGSIAASGKLGQGGATHCYSSDIANRLTGRLTGGPTGCHLDPTTW